MKESLAKADSGRRLLKINPKNVYIQKHADQVDIESAKNQIVAYKKKAIYNESKVYTLKEVTVLYAIASHFMEKFPLNSLIVQYAVRFDPSYIIKNQDKYIRGFGLLWERLFRFETITIFKICGRSKGAVQNFCRRCSNFTLREIQCI